MKWVLRKMNSVRQLITPVNKYLNMKKVTVAPTFLRWIIFSSFVIDWIANSVICLAKKEYAAGTKTETIVQEYTGLSHESLKTIRELCCKEKSNSFLMNYELVNSSIILNKLLCSPRFVYLIAQLVEYEEEIIDYQNLESAAINEVGKEAWQQAPDLYQSKECKLNELSDNQIRTIELFDDYLNKQREYKQREKIYRYNIHEEFELLVEDLYPRLHYNQNN